jgi:capsular exopolysaccharide synthesis family protein
MEKIKKALEKANADRSKTFQHVRRRSVNRSEANSKISDIIYNKTKRIDVSKEYLEKNRVLVEGHSAVSDAYKVLRTQVLQCMRKNNWNSIAITSPTGGNGKTLTAINLAISLSKEVNQTVLLVDLDLRQPKIAKYFSDKPLPGISDYLDGNKEIDNILFNPNIDRLVVLPGDKSYTNSSEMLSSPKMLSLVDELKSFYKSRIIIFDLPPILSCDDVLAFTPYVDSTVLVVEEGRSKKDEVRRSVELLDSNKLIGTVLNKSLEDMSSYSYR